MSNPKIVNIHEAKTNFSKLVSQLEEGRSFIIARAGKPIGKLIPYQELRKQRVPGGSWQGKIKIASDFDFLPKEIEEAFYGE